MSQTKDLISTVDVQRIANEGTKIYEKIKKKYEPKKHGKYLAIEIDSGKAYLADTSVEALLSARKHHPDKVFYMVKVGFDAVETMANSIMKKH